MLPVARNPLMIGGVVQPDAMYVSGTSPIIIDEYGKARVTFLYSAGN